MWYHSTRSWVVSVAIFTAALLIPATAQAQLIERMLTASDAAEVDGFGNSVAISGGVAIAGAPQKATITGSAYLFDVSTGLELFNPLIASDAAQFDRFGSSVGISGGVAIVGAPANDDACPENSFCNSGSAYLFNVTTGLQVGNPLTATGAAQGDQFGSSVAISGGVAIVGAPLASGTGLAYLFDVSTGLQIGNPLTGSGTLAGDFFGSSVAISGDIAIVGAPGNGDFGDFSGSAYLFDVSTGLELFAISPLSASDSDAGDIFGSSVGISGDMAIVGAPGNDDAGNSTGSAYLFNTISGNELVKLPTSNAAAGDMIGRSVAISGNRAIVGAFGNNNGGFSNSGSAYLYDPNGMELIKIDNPDPGDEDNFGFSVAISSGTAIVGASADGVDNSGSAYLFVPQRVGLAWDEDMPVAYSIVTDLAGNTDTVHNPGITTAAVVNQATRTDIRERLEAMFADSGIDHVAIVDGFVEGGTNIYFADQLVIDPSLLGEAFTGIDQFNDDITGGVAVFLTGNGETDAETAGHELGHALGLRHVNPSAADDPFDLSVMDYDVFAGDAEEFINGVSEITEPPDAIDPNGLTGLFHNPVYHLRRYVDGISDGELAAEGIFPGLYDLRPSEGGSAARIDVSLDFGGFDQGLFDVQILAGFIGEAFTELESFASLSLSELEQLSWLLDAGANFRLLAASSEGGPLDVLLAMGDPFNPSNLGVLALLGDNPTSLQLITDSMGGFMTLAAATLQATVVPGPGDFNGDGVVDGFDFLLWQSDPGVGLLADWQTNYGMGAPLSAATTVPEPTTCTLALAALCLAMGIRRSA